MIFIVIIFAFLVRLISLNQSFWLDEATSGLVVRNYNLIQIITKFSPGDFHPPFYYLFLKLWASLFGTSEIALRIPSIIFGILTIYVVCLIGKELFSKKVGLIAGSLLSVSGLFIYYSQEARMYALAAFLVTFLIYLFLKRRWFVFSIVLMLVGLTDYPSLLILPVFWILVKKDWKKLLLSHIPLFASFVFWLPIFLKQLSGGLGVSTNSPGWWKILGETSLKSLVLIPVKFILGRISFDNKYIYGAVVGGISIIIIYLLIKSLREFKKTSILWYWLIIPTILAALVGFKISILSYFRLLFTLPAFYLLIAYGISKSQKYANYLLGLLIISNLIFSGIYLFNPRFHREDWRGLTTFIKNESLNKTSITLFVANSNMEAYRYYDSNSNIAGPDGFNSKYQEIWLMRYLQPVFDINDALRAKIEASGYNKEKEYDFNGVVVWKYSKVLY